MDERNDPAAALPARSMASTTATPIATAVITSSDRPGSRTAGRTMSLKKRAMIAISGLHDTAVAHGDDGVGHCGRFTAVRGHQNGGSLLVANVPEKVKNGIAGRAIEISGGLVRQQNARLMNQSAGNGYALHLTAGELVGHAVGKFAKTHSRQPFNRARAGIALPGKLQRYFHVLHRAQACAATERTGKQSRPFRGGERSVAFQSRSPWPSRQDTRGRW